jgi:hypothetical protein
MATCGDTAKASNVTLSHTHTLLVRFRPPRRVNNAHLDKPTALLGSMRATSGLPRSHNAAHVLNERAPAPPRLGRFDVTPLPALNIPNSGARALRIHETNPNRQSSKRKWSRNVILLQGDDVKVQRTEQSCEARTLLAQFEWYDTIRQHRAITTPEVVRP